MGHILRTAKLSERNRLKHAADAIGIGAELVCHGRERTAGTNHVYAASWRQPGNLVLETTGQTVGEPCLGGGVIGMACFPEDRGRGPDEDGGRIGKAVFYDAAEKLAHA